MFVSGDGRIAIYYAPHPDSSLWRFASAWLGRDAVSGKESPVEVDDSTVRFPRHYGFHATLKPPFHLREDASREELLEAAARFAATRRSFAMPSLVVSRLGNFLALTEAQPSPELSLLAAACVREFEPFRMPLTIEQTAARRRGIENSRQLEMIDQWGYPYVFDQWKFHMTLSSSLTEESLLASTHDRLSRELAPVLSEPLNCDAICLFEQESREQPFRLLSRLLFAS